MSVEEWKKNIEKCIATNGNLYQYNKLDTIIQF